MFSAHFRKPLGYTNLSRSTFMSLWVLKCFCGPLFVYLRPTFVEPLDFTTFCVVHFREPLWFIMILWPTFVSLWVLKWLWPTLVDLWVLKRLWLTFASHGALTRFWNAVLDLWFAKMYVNALLTRRVLMTYSWISGSPKRRLSVLPCKGLGERGQMSENMKFAKRWLTIIDPHKWWCESGLCKLLPKKIWIQTCKVGIYLRIYRNWKEKLQKHIIQNEFI